MLIHDHKTNAAKVYDFREEAPGAASENMFGGDRSKMMKVFSGSIKKFK